MNVEPLLTNLKVTHTALERMLNAELAHPAADPFRITELKRRKLKVKDQIARLIDQPAH
jgi:hypothetical protein